MASQLPETPAAPQPPGRRLPAAQLALEAYWLVTRHPLAYGGQILVLSALAMIIQSVMTILVDGFTAAADPQWRVVAEVADYAGTAVAILLFGGTTIFISCQRAIIIGEPPAMRHALRLRRGDLPVLRALCLYWLIVHLVPTLVAQINNVAQSVPLDWFPQEPFMMANFAFYWAWVLATAPLVVLSLPITLFEAAAAPIAEARRRLDGNTGRLLAASAIALAPLGAIEVAMYQLQQGGWVPFKGDQDPTGFLNFLFFSAVQNVESFTIILVMSALVGAAYLRLSPKFEPIYRVFD